MHPRVRTLQSADPKRSSIKTHIINSQVCGFTTAEAMPVHHQEEKMVPRAMTPSLGGFKEGLHLAWVEEVFSSVWISAGLLTLHITRNGKLAH
jgi:hypothetical protein